MVVVKSVNELKNRSDDFAMSTKASVVLLWVPYIRDIFSWFRAVSPKMMLVWLVCSLILRSLTIKMILTVIRHVENDIALLASVGCAIVFAPSAEEMYTLRKWKRYSTSISADWTK